MADFSPENMLWFRILTGSLIGLVLGSFATMLSYRLPRKLSIILPPSHCPKCGNKLRPQDLVPVFSWLYTKGKCAHCNAHIGARYILIEIATAIFSASAFAIFGLSYIQLLILPALVCLVCLFTIWLERK